MRKLMIVSVVLASLVAAPVAAQAQAGSGVDQYQENIPGAGGNHPDGSNGGHNGGNAGGGGHQGGGGGAAGGGSGGGGSAGGGNSLSPQVTDELNAQGADGAATAAIADSTAPQGSGSGSNGGGNGHSGGSGNGGGSAAAGRLRLASNTTLQSDDGGGAGLGGVVDEILGRNASSSDGMGVALPIILLATGLGAVAFFLLARRRGPNEPGNV